MKLSVPPAISEALNLTRAGDLKGATRAIQAALGGRPMGASPASPNAPKLAVEPQGRAGKAPETAGRFEERSFTSPAGHLTYRLYLPVGANAGMPLVVMLHGCTQSPEDFATGTGMNRLADELGFLVAYPRQTMAANAQKCWNWFQPSDQQRGKGEPALIAGITRQIIADESADATRVYAAGLSAGGAAAAIMAAAYPDLYAAVGIHSGLACGAARDVASAFTAMQNGNGRVATGKGGQFVPVITFHGDRDMTVNEINSREIVAAATAAAGSPLELKIERGSTGVRQFTRETRANTDGKILIEQWTVHGAGHAWSGGDKSGSYADPAGPDASREMLRFFLNHRVAG